MKEFLFKSIFTVIIILFVTLLAGSAWAAEEYYTVQASSYAGPIIAGEKFNFLEQQLPEEHRNYLRVERIKGVYALRTGRFEYRDEAVMLLELVREYFPGAMLMQAYIKDDRIQVIYRQQEEDGSGKEPDPVAGASGDLKGDSSMPAKVTEDKSSGKAKEEAASVDSAKFEEEVVGTSESEIEALEQEGKEKISKKEQLAGDWKIEKYYDVVKAVKIITKDDQGVDLAMPKSVFYDAVTEELYVINGGKSSLVVYDRDYLPLISIGVGRGVFPLSGAVDKDGRLYIGQRARQNKSSSLLVLNAAFFVEKEVDFQAIEGANNFVPERMAISRDGKIYLAGDASAPNGVLALASNGDFLRWLSPPDLDSKRGYRRMGKGGGSIRPLINDVAVDNSGRVYALSAQSSSIYVFSPEGEYLFKTGKSGGTTGKLGRPYGIVIDDSKGYVYVLDYMRHAILAYDKAGKFLFEFGGRGRGPGWFNYPSDIAVNNLGQIIVADYFNNRVQVLELIN